MALAFSFAASAPSSAQTSDDLFNPEVLQRIELWLNEADWAKLQANFQENTYYPADMIWNGQTVHIPHLQELVITGALVSVVPVIVVFVLLQRFWRSGLAVGAVK